MCTSLAVLHICGIFGTSPAGAALLQRLRKLAVLAIRTEHPDALSDAELAALLRHMPRLRLCDWSDWVSTTMPLCGIAMFEAQHSRFGDVPVLCITFQPCSDHSLLVRLHPT